MQALVLHLRSFKREVRNKSLLRVSTVVEWNELHCISLLIPIQLCGGKKTKYSKYNNVFRVFLSFSLTFDAIPCYCDYKIRKFLRYHLFVRFVQILYKKMKKSVAPLSSKGTVQGARKCILQGFLRLFGNLKGVVTGKFFWFFLGKFTTPFRICAINLKRSCWIYRLKPHHFDVYILLLILKFEM